MSKNIKKSIKLADRIDGNKKLPAKRADFLSILKTN